MAMQPGNVVEIDLDQLRAGIGGLSQTFCATTLEAILAAMHMCGHQTGVVCAVQDQGIHKFRAILRWTGSATMPVLRSWRNAHRLCERAAEGIAFVFIDSFTPYTVVQQSAVANPPFDTGIDYFLGDKSDIDSNYDFEHTRHTARLEVSGILQERGNNNLDRRVRDKIQQSMASDSYGTPAFIIVVEFGTPKANLTMRIP